MNARTLILTAIAAATVASFNTYAAGVEVSYPEIKAEASQLTRAQVQQEARNGLAARAGELVAATDTVAAPEQTRQEVRQAGIEHERQLQKARALSGDLVAE